MNDTMPDVRPNPLETAYRCRLRLNELRRRCGVPVDAPLDNADKADLDRLDKLRQAPPLSEKQSAEITALLQSIAEVPTCP